MIDICQSLNKEKLKILWHYTSLEVVKSILSNEKPTFWLSGIRYLNDKSEYKYGLDVINAEIDVLSKNINLRPIN